MLSVLLKTCSCFLVNMLHTFMQYIWPFCRVEVMSLLRRQNEDNVAASVFLGRFPHVRTSSECDSREVKVCSKISHAQCPHPGGRFVPVLACVCSAFVTCVGSSQVFLS